MENSGTHGKFHADKRSKERQKKCCFRSHKQNYFILPTSPKYSKSSINDELDEIIYDTRTYLSELAIKRGDYIPIDIDRPLEETQEKFSFMNYCYLSSKHFQRLCDERNIKSKIICLYPGFSKEDHLYGETKYHFFNLVKYNNRYYIVIHYGVNF